jgi:type I restriction enzyme M protein
MARTAVKKNDTTGNIGFEEKLWAAADKMRGHMDSGEYKHVALGLIFLKYISDSFMEKRNKIETEASDPKSEWFVKEPRVRYGVMEDRDQYLADNVFYVPEKSRWSFLQAKAKQPNIGQLIDDAMVEIEKQNKSLKGVLPKSYARPDLDKQRLGELIDLIGTITLGDEVSRSKDILGRVEVL